MAARSIHAVICATGRDYGGCLWPHVLESDWDTQAEFGEHW